MKDLSHMLLNLFVTAQNTTGYTIRSTIQAELDDSLLQFVNN